MKIAIVNKESLIIATQYEAPAPAQALYGGEWGSAFHTEHIQIPENLDSECIKAELQDGQIVILADTEKSAAKLQKQREDKLEQIRQLREPKLKQVDLLVNQAVLDDWSAENKLALKNYRSALLVITDTYKADMSLLDVVDVNSFSFPAEPSIV